MDDPKLIAALVLFLTNLAGLVKVWGDLAKQKADRADTKAARDKDSQELHDKVLKHDFAIAQLKDSQGHQATVVDDLRDQCSVLNANLVKLDTNVANLTEAIKELKR
jgi:cell division protein FtsB